MEKKKTRIAKNPSLTVKNRVMQSYFNLVYNPVYDASVGQLNLYRELQETCIERLELKDNDRVLCVGIGTGNEISRLVNMNGNIDIVGADYSRNALRKAQKKAVTLGKVIDVLLMDARLLAFRTGSFDKVICIHVTDFVEERNTVTEELIRVLKNGGRFVITYPLQKENAGMGLNIMKNAVRHKTGTGSRRFTAVLSAVTRMMMGVVYLPLLLRADRSVSRREVRTILGGLTTGDIRIEDFPMYNDFIACGIKYGKEDRVKCFLRTNISRP